MLPKYVEDQIPTVETSLNIRKVLGNIYWHIERIPSHRCFKGDRVWEIEKRTASTGRVERFYATVTTGTTQLSVDKGNWYF